MSRKLKTEDETLEILLQLDGEIFPMENGYWTKFEVKRATPNKNMPHGIKYSLTFHDRHNRRIIGFDNAHAYKPEKKSTVPGRSFGTINTIKGVYLHMSTGRQVNCLKTSGQQLRKL